MIEKKVKEKYFNLIDSLYLEGDVAGRMKVFIETYNGTNIKELHHMLLDMFKILVDFPELKLKAEGFDKLKASEKKFDKKFEEIKEEFEDITQGYALEVAAVSE